MKALFRWLAIALVALPSAALAHPHIWIQQVVRVFAKDGAYTHVEIEWRFDPMSSEIEIPLIDENKDRRFSAKEVAVLAKEMLPELKAQGYLMWLNTGGADFRPVKVPTLTARIDDPARFRPPEWDQFEGDDDARAAARRTQLNAAAKRTRGPRNLVYVMRYELPAPVKQISVTVQDPDDFIRIEVEPGSAPEHCELRKHLRIASEFIRGRPIPADEVLCRLP
ncbi:MAG: DUF1007 family protein [Alphaproteobacteria bacterium]|nr:DUF1007 family protein [Alphaproteobacteria bacterium]